MKGIAVSALIRSFTAEARVLVDRFEADFGESFEVVSLQLMTQFLTFIYH